MEMDHGCRDFQEGWGVGGRGGVGRGESTEEEVEQEQGDVSPIISPIINPTWVVQPHFGDLHVRD